MSSWIAKDTTTFELELCRRKQATAHADVQSHCMWLNPEHTKNWNHWQTLIMSSAHVYNKCPFSVWPWAKQRHGCCHRACACDRCWEKTVDRHYTEQMWMMCQQGLWSTIPQNHQKHIPQRQKSNSNLLINSATVRIISVGIVIVDNPVISVCSSINLSIVRNNCSTDFEDWFLTDRKFNK